MSERMTSIFLPGEPGTGLAEYGRKSVPQMIEAIRAHAFYEKRRAEKILAAPDEAFTVDTYLGVHVQRRREVLQDGTALSHLKDKSDE